MSDDGKTLYFADLARNGFDNVALAGTDSRGLTILDVSQIQSRAANPQVTVVSHLTWPQVSTPQTDLPVTIAGHPYLVEVDEFADADNVGAARLIDIADVKAPKVVSNMRLAVNNPSHRNDAELACWPMTRASLVKRTTSTMRGGASTPLITADQKSIFTALMPR